MAGSKHPDATLLLQRHGATDRPQPDLFAYGFELEGVAWTELQIIAEGLGDDDATRSIEGQLGGHNAMSRVGGPICQWH